VIIEDRNSTLSVEEAESYLRLENLKDLLYTIGHMAQKEKGIKIADEWKKLKKLNGNVLENAARQVNPEFFENVDNIKTSFLDTGRYQFMSALGLTVLAAVNIPVFVNPIKEAFGSGMTMQEILPLEWAYITQKGLIGPAILTALNGLGFLGAIQGPIAFRNSLRNKQ